MGWGWGKEKEKKEPELKEIPRVACRMELSNAAYGMSAHVTYHRSGFVTWNPHSLLGFVQQVVKKQRCQGEIPSFDPRISAVPVVQGQPNRDGRAASSTSHNRPLRVPITVLPPSPAAFLQCCFKCFHAKLGSFKILNRMLKDWGLHILW